jgi:hypothetical protein
MKAARWSSEIIVSAVENGKVRVRVGADAVLIDWIQRLMPVRYWSVIGGLFGRLSK